MLPEDRKYTSDSLYRRCTLHLHCWYTTATLLIHLPHKLSLISLSLCIRPQRDRKHTSDSLYIISVHCWYTITTLLVHLPHRLSLICPVCPCVLAQGGQKVHLWFPVYKRCALWIHYMCTTTTLLIHCFYTYHKDCHGSVPSVPLYKPPGGQEVHLWFPIYKKCTLWLHYNYTAGTLTTQTVINLSHLSLCISSGGQGVHLWFPIYKRCTLLVHYNYTSCTLTTQAIINLSRLSLCVSSGWAWGTPLISRHILPWVSGAWFATRTILTVFIGFLCVKFLSNVANCNNQKKRCFGYFEISIIN